MKRKIILIFQRISLILGLLILALFFVPMMFGIMPYIVMSGSMEPEIKTGSVAYIRYNEQTFGIIVCSIEDFNNFYDQETTEAVQLENNCYILYRKLNSFDTNSQDYNDYNKFINTINGISISIKN